MTKTHEHRSFGIVCVHKSENGELEFLIVKHVGGDHWAFSKGTPEKGEEPLETAIRELEEETNISISNLEIKEDVTFQEEYTYVTSDNKNMHKVNTFYLGFVRDKNEAKVNIPDEISEVLWLNYEEAKERLTHEEARGVLDDVVGYLGKN